MPSSRPPNCSSPNTLRHFTYLAKKAMFEMKAGQASLAEEYQQQALAKLVEPAPLWLALLIESIRYKMTKATQNGYLRLWVATSRRRPAAKPPARWPAC